MTENKKQSIILLGHGSRVSGAGDAMLKVAGRLKEKYNFPAVEICFMSRLGPHFNEVLEKCVKNGAEEIIVIPYFLHIGMHLLVDIPEMLQKGAEKFPKVKVILGKNLGQDESLVDLVYKRINESINLPDVKEIELPDREAFPLPPGQEEYVPMPPEEAKKFKEKHPHHHHH